MSNPHHRFIPYTVEHNRRVARERKPLYDYFAERIQHVHLARQPQMRWLSDEMGEVIGQHDVENEQKLIPYIGLQHDPFSLMESNWDFDPNNMEDCKGLINAPLWNTTQRFKPIIGYFLKHQNPKIGFLDHLCKATRKKPYLYTAGGITRRTVEILKKGQHDLSKIWRIYGMCVPVAWKTVQGHFRDTTKKLYFPKTMTFGLDYCPRTHYALYHSGEEKWIYPKATKRMGVSLDKHNPQFATRSIYSTNQQIIARGYDVDEYYNNVLVVRYHFYPLLSLKNDLELSNMNYNNTISYYNNKDKQIKDCNLHAFRYHCKQLEKLRRKV